ncbi:DUF4292 domain-containing protein [Flavobacterium crassostreae]|uniref:Deoxyuridine 5'-triphosphate nucleotidohydrolase n=1 Tax=Flavobacterium crassostreae TaxID=1763534 RepID=A0A1B9E5K0_9FLAO|nr:DUF4292 domain-containing protein [Flavobacterium crassostreae]OCB77240.1 hypothetical protein LPBF_04365 [Flavobacterium crassostreae]
MKKIAAFLLLIMVISCKIKAVSTAATTPASYLKAKTIIDTHYKNQIDYTTLYLKANARFADSKQTQNVTAEIRIKKDEQILVSIRFLGITMAKASITPSSVQYYEKIKGTYFEGDFSSLSAWLGTDLDYNKIQNMLTGEALDDLTKGKYLESLTDQLYRLEAVAKTNTQKTFYIDATDFKVKKQELIQAKEGRMMQILYADTQQFAPYTLPTNVVITSYQNADKAEINLNYNTVSYNEELSFPYSVPNGYNRIIIK